MTRPELWPVTTVHNSFGVDVYAPDLGNKAGRRTSGVTFVVSQSHGALARYRLDITLRQERLLIGDRVLQTCVLIEAAAMFAKNRLSAFPGPLSHPLHVFFCDGVELVKHQPVLRLHVTAIEGL